MIKFDHYYSKEDSDPHLIVSLDFFTYEDHWTQRYIGESALYEPDEMESIGLKNENRKKWARIAINLFNRRINIDFFLKKVGNTYYGRILKDEPISFRKKRNVK